MKNLWIFPNFQVFFKFILGAVSCGAKDGISPWAPQLTAPKKNPTLGAATYGAQEEFHLGRRNLRRPRRILPWAPQLTAPKKNSALGTATYGAQEKFRKKLEKWEKSKVFS